MTKTDKVLLTICIVSLSVASIGQTYALWELRDRIVAIEAASDSERLVVQ